MNIIDSNLNDNLALLNACLNGASGLCLVVGGFFIKKGAESAHRTAMVGALTFSALFLASYITRIAIGGTHPYPAGAPFKGLYLGILASHVLLSMGVPVMAFFAVKHAVKGNRSAHKRVTKYLYPIWLYVSATGIIVYLMLYQLAGV